MPNPAQPAQTPTDPAIDHAPRREPDRRGGLVPRHEAVVVRILDESRPVGTVLLGRRLRAAGL